MLGTSVMKELMYYAESCKTKIGEAGEGKK